MDYKTELIGTNRILIDKIYTNLSNPQQAMRKALSEVLQYKDYDNLTVFIMNQNGEAWVYGLKKSNNKYKFVPIDHDYMHEGETMKIFSGIATIRSMV